MEINLKCVWFHECFLMIAGSQHLWAHPVQPDAWVWRNIVPSSASRITNGHHNTVIKWKNKAENPKPASLWHFYRLTNLSISKSKPLLHVQIQKSKLLACFYFIRYVVIDLGFKKYSCPARLYSWTNNFFETSTYNCSVCSSLSVVVQVVVDEGPYFSHRVITLSIISISKRKLPKT